MGDKHEQAYMAFSFSKQVWQSWMREVFMTRPPLAPGVSRLMPSNTRSLLTDFWGGEGWKYLQQLQGE